jgi:uncharacterized coiled-coil protein SlyX
MAGDPGFWDVAWNWPLPFVTAVAVLAVPMAGIIWFICQLRYKQQIATLKDRVEFVDEGLGDAKEKIGKAEEEKAALHTTVKELNAQIEKLKKRKAQLPRELQSIVDRLATSSATASKQVRASTGADGRIATDCKAAVATPLLTGWATFSAGVCVPRWELIRAPGPLTSEPAKDAVTTLLGTNPYPAG